MYISELLAAITATIFFYKYKYLPVRLILVILWAALLTETGAHLYSTYVYPNNHWVYNLYSYIFYILIFKMVYDYIENATRKKIVATLAILTILAITARALTTPVLTRYMTGTYNIALGIVIIALLYYAIDRLKSNAPLRPKQELELYIFSGYLLFGISFVPISWFRMGQLGFDYSESFDATLRLIQMITLVAMNALFIFGFIWTQPKSKNV